MGNFNGVPGGTKTINATTTSSAVTLDTSNSDMMVQNTGPNLAFIRTAPSGAVALTTDLPLQAGVVIVISKPPTNYSVAAITSTGAATILVTPGSGD